MDQNFWDLELNWLLFHLNQFNHNIKKKEIESYNWSNENILKQLKNVLGNSKRMGFHKETILWCWNAIVITL